MDKNTILTSLQHALANGNGTLDDLNELLKRAQADIATAKQEEAARVEAERKAKEEARRKAEAEKMKRGQEIAEMATRILDEEVTAADVAYVTELYLRKQGLDAHIEAKDIEESVQASQELKSSLGELTDALGELFEVMSQSKRPVKKNTDPDDTLNDFLKSLGLR